MEFTSESHEGVGLGACAECGQECLVYWVDIFDDYWRFCCPIDQVEKAELISVNGHQQEQLHDCARKVLRRHTVLQEHPVHGPSWVDGSKCTLDGPAW
jgi:hypothetical protein